MCESYFLPDKMAASRAISALALLGAILFAGALRAGENTGGTLVGVTQVRVSNGVTQNDIVQIDEATGTVTRVNAVPASASVERSGVNAIDGSGARLFIVRGDGVSDRLVTLDASTGDVLAEAPLATRISHLVFDPGNARVLGITIGDERGVGQIVEINTQTGTFTALGSIGGTDVGRLEEVGVDALDSAGARFFVTSRLLDGSRRLLAINMETGGVLSNVPLTRRLLHMAFSARQGDLVAVTEPTAGETGTFNDLVRINPATGAETVLSTIGDVALTFAHPGMDAVDARSGQFFVTRFNRESDQLLSIDLSSGAIGTAVALSVTLTHLAVVSPSAAPIFSGNLVAGGNTNAPFLVTVTATGNPAPVIVVPPNAFAFLVAEQSSGTTTTAVLSVFSLVGGTVSIPLIARNSAGAVLGNLQITFLPSSFFVPPAVFTTFGFVSPTFAFGTQSSLFNFPLLTDSLFPVAISANALPVGLTLIDNVISGTPTQSGSFVVRLSAENGSASATQELTINISSAEISPGISTGPGSQVVPDVSLALNVRRLDLRLNFAGGSRDSLRFSGILDAPRGFTVQGELVTLDFGGLLISGTADRLGQLRTAQSSVRLRIKKTPRSILGQQILIDVTQAKSSLSPVLSATFENVAAINAPRTFPISVTIGTASVRSDVSLIYNASAGRSGKASTR